MNKIVRNLLILYRKFNVFGVSCRFYPSCSHYAEDAFVKYGLLYGGFLALKRVFRCNQWSAGGFDPVP